MMSATLPLDSISQWELDEANGSIAINRAAGPELVLDRGAVFAPAAGRFGGAASFDGDMAIATAGDVLDPLSSSQSYSLWFRNNGAWPLESRPLESTGQSTVSRCTGSGF